MPLPDFAPGTIVELNGGALALQQKLSYGGRGIAFMDGYLTAAEAAGALEWLGLADASEDLTAVRDAMVRSLVSGREGRLARDLFRRASKRR